MQNYQYGEYQWHSEYMAHAAKRSNDELRYVIKDCQEAIAANPDNSKAGQYADEINYCAMELFKRISK
jgi:hypothetical protein